MVHIGHLLRLEGGEGQKTSICGAVLPPAKHRPPPHYRPRRVEQRLQPQGGVVPTVAGGDGQHALPTVAVSSSIPQAAPPVPVSGCFLPDGLFGQVRVLRSELRVFRPGEPGGEYPREKPVLVLHGGGAGAVAAEALGLLSRQYKGVLQAGLAAAGPKDHPPIPQRRLPDPEPLFWG